MAARKLARAPMPPQQQQQQQQQQQPRIDEVVQSMSFGAESSSDGGSEVADVQLRGQQQSRRFVRGTVTDQQQQQQQQPSQRRSAYMPSKAPPPPPPPVAMRQPQQQLQTSAQSPERPASTIVHQTVYTRAKEPEKPDRRTNLFAPTPRPMSQQLQQSPWSTSGNGHLSQPRGSAGSRQSLNFAGSGPSGGRGGGGGGHTLKGRLTNLFRRKSRKPLPEQEQQQWAGNQNYWQQQQQQQQQRQRRHSGGSAPIAFTPPQLQQRHSLEQHQLASRKNLHTFTYTDAKIYNPNNNVHHVAAAEAPAPVATPSPGPRAFKSQAPAPPGSAADPTVEDSSSRNPVWWNMRTMGATRSAYSTDVLLVRNPEPAPDYDTETTRF